MKKVYFACSIRAGRDDAKLYGQLVEIIKQRAEVLSELFGSQDLMQSAHQALPEHDIWKKDLAMVRQADMVIAEVTNPSLGVGYEIAKAEEWSKPVLALYHPSPKHRLSAMIDGSPQTRTVYYANLKEAEAAITQFLG